MKITFAMIVFNTDFVLRQVLESIIPFAHKVIVVEGPVKYWQDKGFKTSTDDTNKILHEMLPKENIIHGQWKEKTEMCNAFMRYVDEDTNYLWCVDSDEIFKPETIKEVFTVLRQAKPSSLGFASQTFYGGFDYIMGGMEARHSFKRVLKYAPGAEYLNHRPPTLSSEVGQPINKFPGLYHYSYVSPRQVRQKIEYYEAAVIKEGDCKRNYFKKVFLRWQKNRIQTEEDSHGVHEFKSADCFTSRFEGEHPKVIQDSMEELKRKFKQQLDDSQL